MGVQDEFPSACARGCISTFAPRRSENTRRDVISDIRNGLAWPPTFAVFTRDLFHRVCRFPIFVLRGGGRHFRLGQWFVARSTSSEAGAPPRREGTQNPQFRFQGRCWFIPTSSCTEIICVQLGLSIKCIGCVLFRCWLFCTLGRSQELRGVSAYLYGVRFPDTSVFKDAQHVVLGIASVLLPKKQSVPIDPRYVLLMLRPQLGHAIRRLRLVLIRPPVVCEQDFGAPCPIDSVLIGNVYNDSLRCCALVDSCDGPCADQAFSFDGWPSERKVFWEQLCSSEWPCVSRLCVCFMYCVCWVGNVFVVQSVNGVNLLLVQMVGAPTVEIRAMQERDTSGFVGGAHGFSHYDCVCVCVFDVGVCRREQGFKSTQCCDEGSLVR